MWNVMPQQERWSILVFILLVLPPWHDYPLVNNKQPLPFAGTAVRSVSERACLSLSGMCASGDLIARFVCFQEVFAAAFVWFRAEAPHVFSLLPPKTWSSVNLMNNKTVQRFVKNRLRTSHKEKKRSKVYLFKWEIHKTQISTNNFH